MSDNVTVLIADAQRIAAMRADGPLPGTVLYFSNMNLASALESIRAHSPKAVALESDFALSAEGRVFVDRVRGLSLSGSELRLLARTDGRWSTVPFDAKPVAPGTLTVAVNTRRAPRFLVLEPAEAIVDGKATNLIDISVMGAQVTSEPVLRPKQRVRVVLPDVEDTVLRLTAHVAWSAFQKPRNLPTPRYRAGMEFDNTAQNALEQYCRRHCAESPLPYR